MHKPNGVRRRSTRLPGRDYNAGWYFVTLCVQRKVCLFGEASGGRMTLSENGRIVAEEWLEMGNRYPMVRIDAWVVMPNHLHGIVGLRPTGKNEIRPQPKGAQQRAPTITGGGAPEVPAVKPLGQIVGAFKTATTRRINANAGTTGERFWQRNFHEHIIRDATEMERIRWYIRDNPANWETDDENPQNPPRHHPDPTQTV